MARTLRDLLAGLPPADLAPAGLSRPDLPGVHRLRDGSGWFRLLRLGCWLGSGLLLGLAVGFVVGLARPHSRAGR